MVLKGDKAEMSEAPNFLRNGLTCVCLLPVVVCWVLFTATGAQSRVPGAYYPHPEQRDQPRLRGETPDSPRRWYVRRYDRDLRHGKGRRGQFPNARVGIGSTVSRSTAKGCLRKSRAERETCSIKQRRLFVAAVSGTSREDLKLSNSLLLRWRGR